MARSEDSHGLLLNATEHGRFLLISIRNFMIIIQMARAGFVAGGALEPRIDGLAFQGEHTENALVHTAQRFIPDKTLQGFDAKREFALSQGALTSQSTRT